LGRTAGLFAGSELAGKRAATVIGLVQLARMYAHDSWLYLGDVLSRLPTHPARSRRLAAAPLDAAPCGM